MEIRCIKCNRLLMKGNVIEVEVKCPKCAYINFIVHKTVSISKEELEIVHDLMNA